MTPKLPWDGGYHTLFFHQAVIGDLVGLLPEDLRALIDRGWSEPYKTDSYEGPAFQKRDNDVILKMRLLEPAQEALLWLMLEFQLSPQWAMPLRVQGYLHGLQEHLLARLQAEARRRWRDDPRAQQEAIERQRLPPAPAARYHRLGLAGPGPQAQHQRHQPRPGTPQAGGPHGARTVR